MNGVSPLQKEIVCEWLGNSAKPNTVNKELIF